MVGLAQAAGGVSATAEAVAFWVLAAVAVGSGLAVVAMRNIVHGALMLVTNLLAIAGLYVVLGTSFLGVVQIIVYAGAIMVLFLFVIMLLGVDRDDLLVEVNRRHRIGAGLLALLLVVGVGSAFVGDYTRAAARCGDQAPPAAAGARACTGLEEALAETGGSVHLVADRLFRRFTFAFELSALLLVVATIGAIVLGRRRDPSAEAVGAGEPGPGTAGMLPADAGPDTGTVTAGAPADPATEGGS